MFSLSIEKFLKSDMSGCRPMVFICISKYFLGKPTDGPDNAIRLLKTDLNLLIGLLETDLATF